MDKSDLILEKLDTMDKKIKRIDANVQRMDMDINCIKLTIENEVHTNIMRIAEGHLDLSRKLNEATKTNNEYEILTVKVNVLESDMKEIKQKIS